MTTPVSLDALLVAGNDPGTPPTIPAAKDAYLAAAGTSISTTGITVGGSATLLTATLVVCGINAIGSPACTWNGVAMALQAVRSNTNGGFAQTVAIFTLINPDAGAKILKATWTGSNQAYLGAASFNHTDVITGVKVADNIAGFSNTNGSNSVSVNTGANDATLVCIGNSHGGYPAPTNQSAVWVSQSAQGNGAATYALGGSGTNVHTFGGGTTANNTVWAGVHILAVPTNVLPEPPPAGLQYDEVTNLSPPAGALLMATGAIPAAVLTDVFIIPLVTIPDGFQVIGNGDTSLSINLGGSLARQYLDYSRWIQATNTIDGPNRIWINEVPPFWGQGVNVNTTLTAPAITINLALAPYAQSPHGDTMVFTLSDAPPDGITLTSAGLLTIAPTAIGTFSFTVDAADITDSVGTSPACTIVVSDSNPVGTVPSIIGLTSADAQTAITGAGFSVGNISNAVSTAAQKNLVIQQNPTPQSGIPLATAIAFVLGNGPPVPNPPAVSVPNVIGMTQQQAAQAFAEVGLSIGASSSDYG